MALSESDRPLIELIAGHHAGVLTTIKSDGRPQLSNVNYHYYPASGSGPGAGSGSGEAGLIKVSITADRAKYRNLLRDPRASLHVTSGDFWTYAVAESNAEFSEVAADEHDPAVQELIELFRDVQGEHSDWDDYRRAMVADRRVVLRLPIHRVYGMA
ncbi:MAG: PPOX class F420-dependent oxidoreductase [Actinomycetota bacterium]|nr:PPOX class F420-dependent oxidoreductase [Actinomycetota bacterium]MDQ2956183.1 PPOX class F420-dependent oxidoreductase [Actinomycetota bacterium]